MRQDMITVRSTLERLLEADAITAGMYVRVHGSNLIMGRQDASGPNGEIEQDDRVRLTRLTSTTFGLSVKRHTGRWERTPFSGSIKDMVDAMREFMQHIVAPY